MNLTRILILIPCLLFWGIITSCSTTKEQTPAPPCEDYIGAPEQVAQLIGGIESMYKKLRFPESMKRSYTEGEVFAVYFINTGGEVDKVVIQSATSVAFANEVMRVSRSIRFEPAQNNGIPVCSQFAIPIRFRAR